MKLFHSICKLNNVNSQNVLKDYSKIKMGFLIKFTSNEFNNIFI